MSRKFKRDATIAGMVSRIRGFILDSQVEHSDHIIELLIGVVMSDDVADREAEESDVRTDRIRQLIPILYLFANSMAEGLVQHQRAHVDSDDEDDEYESGGKDLPEEAWKATERVFAEIAFSTAVGAVSQLLDMGLIETYKKRSWFWKRK